MISSKKKVAVLFGGCSSEYEVSLQSAAAILAHIDRQRYQIIMIGIRRDGEWFLYEGPVAAVGQDTWHAGEEVYPVTIAPGQMSCGFVVSRAGLITQVSVDAALPVLHGTNGEDGTVQGLLALAGIPVIGCDVLSSAVCMDKDMAHRIVSREGIRVPRSRLLKKGEEFFAPQYAAEIGYPVFIKPLRAGSSFGITKVPGEWELNEAIGRALQYDTMLVMEEAINGFEVGCAILGDTELTIGEVDEITLTEGFFDYTEKYTLAHSQIHVPARISPEQAARIKDTAVRIFRTLRCRHFARVDMFLTPDGEIYFNEVNTIPGFTQHSRYPAMLQQAGVNFGDMVNRMLEMVV